MEISALLLTQTEKKLKKDFCDTKKKKKNG